ncbi:cytochrome P450 9e2-like [Zophobas morio]|uniref:cytochrome P450 9e2-like n=1 Tax=Zophobas morio TaxID=2755281 RepID=UPI0030835774
MWWLLVTIAVALGYWLLIRPHRYWLRKGVKQGTPGFIFGDNWGTVLRKQSFADMMAMVYNVSPNTRYSGFYQFLLPTLLVKDPDLIKQITVKDFDHFVDHRSFIPGDSDPLWGRNLFALNGKKWREMRTAISPAFTTTKMKHMFTLISQSGEHFIKYLSKNDESLITVEIKDIFTRITNDVIANTVFGVECDSLENKSNEFYMMGKEATNFSSFWMALRFFGYICVPKLFKFLQITLFPKQVLDFFTNVVKNSIQSHNKHDFVRPDMIHFLLQARKNGLKQDETEPLQDTEFEINKNSENTKVDITDEDILSQAFIFFFAGFDGVASLMSFMSHELAVNPDIQTKLIQEVDANLEACKDKLTYEALLGMKYLDMVVSETLRKWPNSVAMDRICTKPYTIEAKYPDEKSVHLKEGDVISVPVFGLHRDPEYYPEPERFDPERFSDENKDNIKPYTYLPFGSGPRNCIGSRLALLEAKTLMFNVLSNFELVPVEKTQIPMVLSKKSMSMTAEKGFWLGLKRRSRA